MINIFFKKIIKILKKLENQKNQHQAEILKIVSAHRAQSDTLAKNMSQGQNLGKHEAGTGVLWSWTKMQKPDGETKFRVRILMSPLMQVSEIWAKHLVKAKKVKRSQRALWGLKSSKGDIYWSPTVWQELQTYILFNPLMTLKRVCQISSTCLFRATPTILHLPLWPGHEWFSKNGPLTSWISII